MDTIGEWPHRSEQIDSNGFFDVISQSTKGSWCNFPTLQESQNERAEREQGIQILFKINCSTLNNGCPNLACHCWHTLLFWATFMLGDSSWQNELCLLQLFKEETLLENTLGLMD